MSQVIVVGAGSIGLANALRIAGMKVALAGLRQN